VKDEFQEDVDEEGSFVVTSGGDGGVSLRHTSQGTYADSGHAAYCHTTGSRAINQPGNTDAITVHFGNIAGGDACLNVTTSDTCGGIATFNAYGCSAAPDAGR
jgi:hypothetical protein